MMDFATGLTIVLSVVALLISIRVSIIQNMQTTKALAQDQNFSRANTVIHFTNSFFSLIGQNRKSLEENFQDKNWRGQYWGLLSAEFYFYHHNIIPPKMFALWMSELADAYRRYDGLWESHEAYLNQYDSLYGEMNEFFRAIYDASKDGETMYNSVNKNTINWLKKHGVHEIE